ncbi:MAG: glycosyltransferase family 1 protein [Candidatus Lokiarchaeota archaeon]|nr:glycosyltransferase family 1 protein [Candidatus Lokiarchaeota archaeon]
MTEEIRICEISVHGDPLGQLGSQDTGGQCVYIEELTKAMTEHRPNLKIDCFTRWYEGKKKEENISKDVKVIRIPCGSEDFVRKEDMYPLLDEFAKNLLDYTKKNNLKYRIIHSHYWDGGVAAVKVAKSLNILLIHTNHSAGRLKKKVLDSKTLKYDIRIREEDNILAYAKGVLALTETEKQSLIEEYKLPAEKIYVVPGGLDLKQFYPIKDIKKAKNDLNIKEKNVIFALGRTDPRKGFEWLIRTIPHIIEKVDDVKLYIGGGSLPEYLHQNSPELNERNRLLNIAKKLEVSNYIHFTGHLSDEDVTKFYSVSDTFVVPSIYEPFGLVLLEAMACKTVVIATNNGGPVNIVDDGVDGFLVDVKDTKEFADKIIKILTDEKLKQKMILAGYEKATELYSWQTVSKKVLEEVYLKIS